MKKISLVCGIFLGLSVALLRAGTLTSLSNFSTSQVKLSIADKSIEIASNSQRMKFDDVLEANFNDAGFYLDYFSSKDCPTQLPANWQAKDIGPAEIPGTFTYVNGTLTLTCSTGELSQVGDRCYFIARPWADDDGQWIVHVKERTPEAGALGLMLRTDFEPGAPRYLFGPNADNGFRCARTKPNTVPGWDGRFVAPVPGWIRMTRYRGALMQIESSSDAKTWDMIEQLSMSQDGIKVFNTTLAGMFLTGSNKTVPAKVVMDQISFTPAPCQPETILPGVLLRSGTFLKGYFNGLGQKDGNFNRSDKPVVMAQNQVSAVIWIPTLRHQITAVSDQTGVIMKNGDFLGADFENLDGGGVRMNSLILGPMEYHTWDNILRACILHPLQPQPSNYEIRLKDGSIIFANDWDDHKEKDVQPKDAPPDKGKGKDAKKDADKNKKKDVPPPPPNTDIKKIPITIKEVSGIDINITLDEVAQFRAGTAKVQSIFDLPRTMSAPAGDTLEAAAPLQCWEGNNQEQIMLAANGTTLNFTMPGKFRTLVTRVALSPNAPPNSQASVHVKGDGRDLGSLSSSRPGDQPQFATINIMGCQTISFTFESTPGARLLLVDPVAIRQ